MAKDTVLSQDQLDAYLKKQYGNAGDPNEVVERPEFYGTGVPSIDWALGGGTFYGGFPAGHMTEVYGREAVGKTSLVYRAIAHGQRTQPEKMHVILDYEHTTDETYIKACGVDFDPNKLRILRPKTMEQGIEMMLLFMKTGKVGIFCIDSLAAMNPAGELKRMSEDVAAMGVSTKAKLLAHVCRLLVPELNETGMAVVFINHEIANIVSNPYQGGYNPPTVTPGGNALKYYTSMRIQLNFKGMLTAEGTTLDGKEVKHGVGKKIQAYVEKFKFGNPGQRVDYLIRAGEGIDTITPLIATGIQNKLIEKKGGTHNVKLPGFDTITARSADAFRDVVKANPELQAALLQACGGTIDAGVTMDGVSDDIETVDV
jgi:recombination protein RecA